MRTSTVARSIAIALITAASARGQKPSNGRVIVSVRDSAGTPIANAELTLTRGLKEILSHSTTDEYGHGAMTFEVGDSTDLQITMRKIGFSRTDRFFEGTPSGHDSVTVVVAHLNGQVLAPVKVTAQADAKRKSYFLSADDIEASDQYLQDGWDVVKWLRPDMLTSRGGCSTGVQNVWVNGKWIRLPLTPTGVVAMRARAGVPPRARYTYAAVSILSEIAPEHIQEITYHDCFDTSMNHVGGFNAMVITLKPGIEYQENVGSFVVDPGPTSDKKP